MPTLLAPGALAALAALALPLLIHLARRTEDRPTDFAALRWLRAKPRPRRRPKFDEWPLLIVRLLLLTLLAAWLARPATPAVPDRRIRAFVVPGVASGAAARLVAKGADARWLAPGFPPLTNPAPRGAVPVVSLVRDVDASVPHDVAVHVFVPAIFDGADAELPRLSHRIGWHIASGVMATASPATPRPLRLAIRAPVGRSDTRYLTAVATAWQSIGSRLDLAPLAAPLPDHDAIVAWLGRGGMSAELMAWVTAGGTVLVPIDVAQPTGPTVAAAVDRDGRPFLDATSVGKGRVLRFTHALTPPALPALFEPDFPDRLRAAVRPPPAPTRTYASGLAPEIGGSPLFHPTPLREWRNALAATIAGLLLVERWLATRRRRWSAP